MKIHMLKGGARMPKNGISNATKCGATRGHLVEVRRSREGVTCGRCLQVFDNEVRREEIQWGTPDEPFKIDEIVHYSESGEQMEPGDRAWCRKKIDHFEHSSTTTSFEEVSCLRCRVKLSS